MTARTRPRPGEGFAPFDTGFTSTFKPAPPPAEDQAPAIPPAPDLAGAIDIAAQYLGMTRPEFLEAIGPVVAEHRIAVAAAALGIPADKALSLLLELSPGPDTHKAALLRIRTESLENRLEDRDWLNRYLFDMLQGTNPGALPSWPVVEAAAAARPGRRSLFDRLTGRR